LGINGVTVAVSYPLLMPDLPANDQYAAFYTQVAQEVRKRHMKLDVEIGAVFANTPFAANLPPYHYANQTFSQYESAIRSMTKIVVSQMSPDYFNIGSEPDIGASLTGIREFLDPATNAEYVRSVLNSLEKGQTKMAAGIGNWSNLSYVRKLVQQPDLDCINVHIYPFYSGPQLTLIAATADVAKENGKCVIIDEAWLSKTIGNEGSAASNPDIF
jgi:arabinogalactan endo-1,4-beta-galactosidase